MTEQIAIYGKGGVGKTTLAANLSAALAEMGKRVLLVGCDLKADAGTLIHGSEQIPTLFDYLHRGEVPHIDDIVVHGYRGVACVEVGDSLAEDECATKSMGRALELLRKLDLVRHLQSDYVVYDIPGEIGCSAIAVHLNALALQRTFIVTSGDLMSFYAANSFIRSVVRQSGMTSTAIIGNALTGSFEESFVDDFARQVHAQVAGLIPRSLVVRHSELYGKTVIELSPDSTQARLYRRLAQQIIADRTHLLDGVPKSLSVTALRKWARGWGDRLGELEFGIIQDGAGI
jgi:nitrogenase iron protein NifH